MMIAGIARLGEQVGSVDDVEPGIDGPDAVDAGGFQRRSDQHSDQDGQDLAAIVPVLTKQVPLAS